MTALLSRRALASRGTCLDGLLLSLLSCLSVFSLGACSDVSIVRPGLTQVYYQVPPAEVDILLIIDDSCSMEAEQDELAEGFERFVEFFDIADVDYHIAVTTTDVDNIAGSLINYGGFKVITPETPSPSEVFAANVEVGILGSGFERGLDAAKMALNPLMLEGPNADFLREEAALSLIFVSDEEDISHEGVHSYIDHFLSLKGENVRRDVFNASALIGLDPTTGQPGACGDPSEPLDGAVGSLRYFEMARQTRGSVGSICDEDFSDVVGRMGLNISRLIDSFQLERRPREGTLELQIVTPGPSSSYGSGVIVPPEGIADGQWAWEYTEDIDRGEYFLRFVDPYSLPPLDSQIILDYELF